MNRRRVIGTGFAAYGTGLLISSGSLARDGGEPGFTGDGLARLDAHFTAAVESGERAGYVVSVGRKGRVAHQGAIGLADIASDEPMRPRTLFRIASLTKLVTSVAALQLLEEGRLQLDDPVAKYLPEIGAMQVASSAEAPDDLRPPLRAMTIRHLMLHMSGIGYRFDAATALGRRYQALDLFQKPGSLAQAVQALAELPLYSDPGERVIYSFSTDVLGRLIEVVSGESLDQRLKRTIFHPLGMEDTAFFVPPVRRRELATIYRREEANPLTPSAVEVFGDPLDPHRWPSGGAGLVSTAPDYLRFLMALERQGTLDRAQILSTETVALLTRNHLPAAILARLSSTPLAGLGFGLGSAVFTGPAQAAGHFRDGDCFWSGHFDTQYFFSPSTGVAAVIMTQLAEVPGAPPSRTAADLRALVYGALIQ